MGTRNLICVVKDNEYKVAQYSQWDGYPSGQGITILDFLTNEMNRCVFEEKLDNMISFGTEEEIQEQWKECGADDSGWANMEISDLHRKLYPENSRDTGANILNIIQNTIKPLKLQNNIDFAANSLYCEWAYVIDLDKNTFEVYQGFNEYPLTKNERFYNMPKIEYKIDANYYPVKHIVSFDINNLPTEEDFLKTFEEDDE